jgi:hypothetical protein
LEIPFLKDLLILRRAQKSTRSAGFSFRQAIQLLFAWKQSWSKGSRKIWQRSSPR